MSTSLPRDLPQLRAEAERLTRQRYDDLCVAYCEIHITLESFEGAGSNPMGVEATAMSLADLTRPESLAWAARLLASLEGMREGVDLSFHHDGCASCWWLENSDEEARFAETGGAPHNYVVPGLSRITDPAEAMVLCILAMLG